MQRYEKWCIMILRFSIPSTFMKCNNSVSFFQYFFRPNFWHFFGQPQIHNFHCALVNYYLLNHSHLTEFLGFSSLLNVKTCYEMEDSMASFPSCQFFTNWTILIILRSVRYIFLSNFCYFTVPKQIFSEVHVCFMHVYYINRLCFSVAG